MNKVEPGEPTPKPTLFPTLFPSAAPTVAPTVAVREQVNYAVKQVLDGITTDDFLYDYDAASVGFQNSAAAVMLLKPENIIILRYFS